MFKNQPHAHPYAGHAVMSCPITTTLEQMMSNESMGDNADIQRRKVMVGGAAALAAAAIAVPGMATAAAARPAGAAAASGQGAASAGSFVKMKDGTEIFYKD